MRGKGSETQRRAIRAGITPAYAGKSNGRRKAYPVLRDHPRVCGEKFRTTPHFLDSLGSPPRMRGKAVNFYSFLCFGGITPAYAGKRSEVVDCCGLYRDHPRVCGEKTPSSQQLRLQLGSPPRMRGKGTPNSVVLLAIGITPAYAGKSFCVLCALALGWDHPRVCGEKFHIVKLYHNRVGSPPRMRGKV